MGGKEWGSRDPFPGRNQGNLQEEDPRGRDPPDLTLPLVEMAEMDRPVMDVTSTESRMMIQVRTEGVA